MPRPDARLHDLIDAVQPLDSAAMATARVRQASLIKPPGSLGRLEDLSVHLAGITARARPRFERTDVVIMAADHGVTAEGVSAYPAAVTGQMVRAVLAEQAAISVLARQFGVMIRLVDLGVAAALPRHPGLLQARVRSGTANFCHGPAMTRDEAVAAITAGAAMTSMAGPTALIVAGELGIGNSTAAAALTTALTGAPAAATVGRGTGIDDAGLRRKVAAVERALAINQPDPADPVGVLATVGGLEIAGLVGLVLAAAGRRSPVLLDGYITTAAALVAVGLCPLARDYLIASHRSAEPGHGLALAHLGLTPLLDLQLRLGEGTGGLLAVPLVRAAVAMLDQMATFAEAGVSEEVG